MKAFHEVRKYATDFMVWHSTYEDISFLAHWHQELEFILIRSGSAHISVNEHEFTACEGDLVIVDTGDFHYSDSSEMKNQLDFIVFDPSLVSSLYVHSRFVNPLVTKQMLQEYGLYDDMLSLFSEIGTELAEKKPYYQDIVKASLRRFFYSLKRVLPKTELQTQNKHETMLYDMQQLLSFLEKHYPENITLSDAAERMNFSDSHFSKVFKKLIGINYVTYLSMLRIEHAAARLKHSSDKITDIALQCGFNNVRTFNRAFKEVTGYTPSQFLKLPDPDSYNLTYYKRKSAEQEFVENDSLTVVKNSL